MDRKYCLSEEEITGITSSHQVSPFIVRVIAAAEHEATTQRVAREIIGIIATADRMSVVESIVAKYLPAAPECPKPDVCVSCGEHLVVTQHLDYTEDNGKKYCLECSHRQG